MVLRTFVLLTIPALAGCASPLTSVLSTLGVASETARGEASDRGLSAESLDGERGGEQRTIRRPAKRSSSSTVRPTRTASVALTPALTRVVSNSPDSFSLAAPPAEDGDERARLARSMEERYRQWDDVAERAIRSICSGC